LETTFDTLRELQPTDLFPGECRVCWSEPRPLLELEHADEVALATGWAIKVQELYCAGRLAAHQALNQLGRASESIGRGSDGAPLWPTGVRGSITHTAGLALVVLSDHPGVLALGIDVEKEERTLQPRVAGKVASQTEGDWIGSGPSSGFRLLRLLSAKEAIFKAFSSLMGIRLGFLEARLTPIKGGFAVEILHPRVCKELGTIKLSVGQGRWEGYLVSGLCVMNPK